MSHTQQPLRSLRNGLFLSRNLDSGKIPNARKTHSPASPAGSLAEQLEKIGHALTDKDLAELLRVSAITIYKLAKTNKLPSFRVGTAVRFDPQMVAEWLRQA